MHKDWKWEKKTMCTGVPNIRKELKCNIYSPLKQILLLDLNELALKYSKDWI